MVLYFVKYRKSSRLTGLKIGRLGNAHLVKLQKWLFLYTNKTIGLNFEGNGLGFYFKQASFVFFLRLPYGAINKDLWYYHKHLLEIFSLF